MRRFTTWPSFKVVGKKGILAQSGSEHSTKLVARTNADQKKDRQHPQSKSCDTPSSKQAAFFEDCKINPITNDSNRQTCLFSLSVFPPFLSNLILQDSAFSADYLF